MRVVFRVLMFVIPIAALVLGVVLDSIGLLAGAFGFVVGAIVAMSYAIAVVREERER